MKTIEVLISTTPVAVAGPGFVFMTGSSPLFWWLDEEAVVLSQQPEETHRAIKAFEDEKVIVPAGYNLWAVAETGTLVAVTRQTTPVVVPAVAVGGLSGNLNYTGFALVGDHASITAVQSPVTATSIKWGTSLADVDGAASLGTGNSPTDFTAADSGDPDAPGVLHVRATINGTDVYSSANIRAPIAINTVAPAISTSGTGVGDVVSLSQGTWTVTGQVTYARRIYVDGNLVATNADYVITGADSGKDITGEVEAVTSGGLVLIGATGSFSVEAFVAPSNTAAPVVSGGTGVGDLLSVTTGSWTANPGVSSYTYQWRRNTVDLPGETANTYTTVIGDAGTGIDCIVRAVNAIGSTPQNSNFVSITASTAPSISGVPTISGTVAVGEILTAAPATTTGTPTITRTWQWFRTGSPISGATDITYTVTAVDSGSTLTVRQTETSIYGSDNATSAATISVPFTAGTQTQQIANYSRVSLVRPPAETQFIANYSRVSLVRPPADTQFIANYSRLAFARPPAETQFIANYSRIIFVRKP